MPINQESGRRLISIPQSIKFGANGMLEITRSARTLTPSIGRTSPRSNVNLFLLRRSDACRQQSAAVSSLDAFSVALTLTGTTTNSIARCNHISLHQDVVILSTKSSKPQIPIAIPGLMPHLTLQMGKPKEEKDYPALQCMLDFGASLSNANFHYLEAVIKQYPHILKVIYLHNSYTTIVLSGIVTTPNEAPVTMELAVGFKVFLPYLTKDRNETSLLVAADPDIAVNLIPGLPFIKATGMIPDFVNNVCQAKHLLADPFPINFRCAMKSIPAIGTRNSASHCAKHKEVHQALGLLNAYFANKQPGHPLHLIVPLSADQGFLAGSPKKIAFGSCWEPPAKSASDANDYQHQVPGGLGYL